MCDRTAVTLAQYICKWTLPLVFLPSLLN